MNQEVFFLILELNKNNKNLQEPLRQTVQGRLNDKAILLREGEEGWRQE